MPRKLTEEDLNGKIVPDFTQISTRLCRKYTKVMYIHFRYGDEGDRWRVEIERRV